MLTRNFLVGLQENFPATIPTIFRTGDKLNRNDEIVTGESDERCLICEGKRDALGTTLEATNFSKLVSCKGKDNFEKDINLAVENIINMDINKQHPEKGNILELYYLAGPGGYLVNFIRKDLRYMYDCS